MILDLSQCCYNFSWHSILRFWLLFDLEIFMKLFWSQLYWFSIKPLQHKTDIQYLLNGLGSIFLPDCFIQYVFNSTMEQWKENKHLRSWEPMLTTCIKNSVVCKDFSGRSTIKNIWKPASKCLFLLQCFSWFQNKNC